VQTHPRRPFLTEGPVSPLNKTFVLNASFAKIPFFREVLALRAQKDLARLFTQYLVDFPRFQRRFRLLIFRCASTYLTCSAGVVKTPELKADQGKPCPRETLPHANTQRSFTTPTRTFPSFHQVFLHSLRSHGRFENPIQKFTPPPQPPAWTRPMHRAPSFRNDEHCCWLTAASALASGLRIHRRRTDEQWFYLLK